MSDLGFPKREFVLPKGAFVYICTSGGAHCELMQETRVYCNDFHVPIHLAGIPVADQESEQLESANLSGNPTSQAEASTE